MNCCRQQCGPSSRLLLLMLLLFLLSCGFAVWFHWCCLSNLAARQHSPPDVLTRWRRAAGSFCGEKRLLPLFGDQFFFFLFFKCCIEGVKLSSEVCHAESFTCTHINDDALNNRIRYSLFPWRCAKRPSALLPASCVCEPVQRDLTRALQGEGNKTQRDEANILILLS